MANRNRNKDFQKSRSQGKFNKNTGRYRGRNGGRHHDPVEYKPDMMGESNDMTWYDKNPNLTLGAARIPFPYRPGMKIPMVNHNGQTAASFQMPGVFNISWAPFVGLWNDSTSPVSLAAQDVFNRVRASFSGSIDADSPDFMMYFLALDSCFSYIANLKRIYRVAATYSPENYTLPMAVLRALGFDSLARRQEVIRDRNKLWQGINTLISAMGRFKCPAVYPLFNRHYWLNDNVYMDHATPNSQIYVLTQAKYLKFSHSVHDTVATGCVEYVSPSAPETGVVDAMIDFGFELINALATTDDTFIISGYLKRAYEGTPDFTVDPLPLDERLMPVYDEVVLSQIENAYTPFNDNSCTLTLNRVVQDPGTNVIKTEFEMTIPEDHQYTPKPYLNIRSISPSPVDVVEASRLQTVIQFDESLGAGLCAGTEVVLAMNMWASDGAGAWTGYRPHQVITSKTTSDDIAKMLDMAAKVSHFDWHPAMFVIDCRGATPTVVPCVDLTNFTTMSYRDMWEINRVCMLSEFNAFSNQ